MDNSNTIYTGEIKVYFPLRGFGFITRNKGKDVYFSRDSIDREFSIIEGAHVSFKLKKTEKGYEAINLERMG